MKYAEAAKLKKGDLVVIDKTRNKVYGGMIFEIDEINTKHDIWCYRVTLKQPGFNNDFRIKDYDTRLLRKYEL